jgi:thiosulfate reductase/polysulfide reductase chain A
MGKKQKRYGMLINLNRCIGCYSCQVTCKVENEVPYGLFRCRLETVQAGRYPKNKKFFIPKLCNHCADAPCIRKCPDNCMVKNTDGIVLINLENCSGCGECIEACPYDAIYFNPATGKIDKCDFCIHRVTKGLPPACVENCMGKAMIFGDLNDHNSDVFRQLKKENVKVLNREYDTNPRVFYTLKGQDPKDSLKGIKKIDRAASGIAPVSVEPAKGMDRQQKIVYTSDVMCPSECGIKVLVQDGTAKRIYGSSHTLVNNGTLCARGAAGLQFTYSPYRIKTPLIRTGHRGDDKWSALSWDEACETIAAKLVETKNRFGPESIILDCGDVSDREAYYRLFHAFGTPNTYNHGSICDTNRRWGQGIMMGDERPLPDLQRPVLIRDRKGGLVHKVKHDAKIVLNIGANPLVATRFNYMAKGIAAAREENGCIYIVVDPSFTNSAAMADIWLPIRPGSDPEFMAALLYFILENDNPSDPSRRYMDHEFIRAYTTGWEDFRSAFLSYSEKKDPSNDKNYFTLEWAEEKTGISKGEIKNAAHLFGKTKPASIEIGIHGIAHHTNGDVASVLMTALCLITGNVDIPGGLVFIDSQKVKKGIFTSGGHFLEKMVTRTINGKTYSGRIDELDKDLYGEYPAAWKGVLTDLPTKIRDGVRLNFGPFKGYQYPIKAFINRAGNPIITAGNTSDWIDAFTRKQDNGDYQVDFIVFIDTHINETGKFADVILPEAGFLERMGLSDVYTFSPEVALRDQVIKPLHESRTPFQIMISLAAALEKNGDPDIKAGDFAGRYCDEEDFINEILRESPGYHNIGEPLPYPNLPEGSVILGVPDNPTGILDDTIVTGGEPLTVDWLRKNKGVAIWPAGYKRYSRKDGSISNAYPKTTSGKFEFKFSYLENINKKFGTHYPNTFYWEETKWNPNNKMYTALHKDFPFQLISGRAHHSMTMTQVCAFLGETETECMKLLNERFKEIVWGPDNKDEPDKPRPVPYPPVEEREFKENSFSIPVFSINSVDGKNEGIKTGDLIILENPLRKQVRGKAFLTDEIMPGVIKTVFGSGGRSGSGMGMIRNTRGYTPNINELVDPGNINRFTGMPGYGDIMVRIIKT